MVDRASIFQTVQIGVEATAGTLTAANRALQSLSIQPGDKVEVSKFRPMGMKFPTLAALGKEWVEAKLSGQATYEEIVYPLASVLKAVTPTRITDPSGVAYQWVFAPSSTAGDAVKTFTVEQGDASRAHRFTYGLVTGLDVEFGRKEVKIGGTMIGRGFTDGVTMTSSPTALAMTPVLPAEINVYLADTHADLDTATALGRAINAKWSISDRFGPVWRLNRADASSFAAHVETEPKLSVKLKVEADAEGMGLLSKMRSGDVGFVRIEAVGAEIETGNHYELVFDMAFKVEDMSEFSDEDGVFALEWGLAGVHDATWGKALEVRVVNTIAAL